MAVIKCKECGHDVADTMVACPNGGYKVAASRKSGKASLMLVGVVAFAAFLVFGACKGGNGKDVADEQQAPGDSIEKLDAKQEDVYDRNDAVFIKPTNVECYNTLDPQAGNTYYPKNLIDGNSKTVWAVHLDNSIYDEDRLYGPSFTIKCKKLSHIIIRNGYGKSDDAYKNNARAAKVRFVSIKLDDDSPYPPVLFEGELEDTPEPQRLEIPMDLADNNDIQEIQMVFYTPEMGGVYPGRKWNDLCISEVEFWGFK